MGRPKRVHYRNAVYHVIDRGNGGRLLFRTDEDCLIFLGILEDVTRKTGCRVLILCLERNHFHLLVQIGDVPLSVVMQRLLCRYARYFNKVHERLGHVFQSRFKAKLCATNAYLAALIRYIHNNPVKDGLVERPEDWLWSSHRQYIGSIRSTLVDVEAGLALLDSDPTMARRRYAKLMGEQDPGFEPTFDPGPMPARCSKAPKPAETLEKIASGLRAEEGVEFIGVTSRRRSRELSRLRREFARRAEAEGYGNSAIARFMGVHPSAVSHYARV